MAEKRRIGTVVHGEQFIAEWDEDRWNVSVDDGAIAFSIEHFPRTDEKELRAYAETYIAGRATGFEMGQRNGRDQVRAQVQDLLGIGKLVTAIQSIDFEGVIDAIRVSRR